MLNKAGAVLTVILVIALAVALFILSSQVKHWRGECKKITAERDSISQVGVVLVEIYKNRIDSLTKAGEKVSHYVPPESGLKLKPSKVDTQWVKRYWVLDPNTNKWRELKDTTGVQRYNPRTKEKLVVRVDSIPQYVFTRESLVGKNKGFCFVTQVSGGAFWDGEDFLPDAGVRTEWAFWKRANLGTTMSWQGCSPVNIGFRPFNRWANTNIVAGPMKSWRKDLLKITDGWGGSVALAVDF